ncbi:MAG: hypothetical protein QME42_01375 [bacterium]|nr:hypothetical protein [bacterium]
MTELKITVLGGSSSYTPEFIQTLIDRSEEFPPLHLMLTGRNEANLSCVAGLVQRMITIAQAPFKVSFTTDRIRAIADAAYIINQIRVGGLAARDHDDTFPLSFGIPGDESIGPGGLANAMRTVPVVLEIVQEIERYASKAWFLNLTNPCSIVLRAIVHFSKVRTLGICDLPEITVQKIAALMGLNRSQIKIDYVGINHQGWIYRIRNGNKEITKEVIDTINDSSLFGIEPAIIKAQQAIPIRYLALYYHPEREVQSSLARTKSRVTELKEIEKELYSLYKDPKLTTIPPLLKRRGVSWYREALVPILLALINDRSDRLILNTTNNGVIEDLPMTSIVELPAIVSQEKVNPLPVGHIPIAFRGLLMAIQAYEELALEATIRRTQQSILLALLSHPLVPSYEVAEKLISYILENVTMDSI